MVGVLKRMDQTIQNTVALYTFFSTRYPRKLSTCLPTRLTRCPHDFPQSKTVDSRRHHFQKASIIIVSSIELRGTGRRHSAQCCPTAPIIRSWSSRYRGAVPPARFISRGATALCRERLSLTRSITTRNRLLNYKN